MSRTKRTNALLMSLTLAFILTLGAGVVVGVAAGRRTAVPDIQVPKPTTHPTTEPKTGGWLSDSLGLNSDQQKKLKSVWTETIQPSQRAYSSKRSQLLKDRDEVLFNLLTDEQKQQYQEQMAHYSSELTKLNAEREAAIKKAIEPILDENQREKYEQMILKKHEEHSHGDHDRQQHGGGPRGHNNGQGRGSPYFGDPRTQPARGGPTEELKDTKEFGTATTRPG